jgi:hypothetical protein
VAKDNRRRNNKIQEDYGMTSRGQLEIATLGSSSCMPYAPQGVKRTDDDDDDNDDLEVT